MYSNDEIEITELTETTGNQELTNVCYTLYGYQRKGINAYYVFEGIKIYAREIQSPEDIERMFNKVYGCSYEEKVQRTVAEKKVEWVKYGFENFPQEKHAKWLEYVDQVCANMHYYQFGNPITDAIRVIDTVNDTDDRDLLKEIVIAITGSQLILFKAVVAFSNKGELLEQINEELKNTPPSGPKF